MTLIAHSSQFMGEMDLCLLNCPLLAPRVLYHLPSTRLLQHHPLLLSLLPPLLLQSLNLLLHAHSVTDVPGKSGYQISGKSHLATSRLESQLQPFPLPMRRMIQMIHWTFSMRTQPLSLSPHLIGSPSYAPMQICGGKLVRKRWRPTV